MKKMEKMNSKFLRVEEKREWDHKQRKIWKILILLLTIAFGLRIFLLIHPEVIHNDGTEYVHHARQILSGNWMGGKAPPFYPFLIALFHFFTNDYEMAGIWVSVIFGTVLLLPIFFLARAIFNEKVGVISALLAAVHPFLYMSSGSVLTESLYYFLFATSVLFGWNVFSKGRFSDILLFSLFTSLAYLTRPEGIGFLFVLSAWVLLVNPVNERRSWARRGGIILLIIFCFLALSSFYLIRLRQETGGWQISKKFSISLESRGEEEGASLEKIIKKKEINLFDLIGDPLAVLKRMGVGLLNSFYKFQQAFTPLLFLLALLGWIFNKEGPYSLRGNLYVLSYLIFFLGLVLPFFWITRRYTSQMIPICLPWAASGFLGSVGWLSQRFKGEGFRKKGPIFLLMVILIGIFVQGRVLHSREHRFIQRELGFWMKEHLPKGAKVMSRLPQEAFYAELPWHRMHEGSYEGTLQMARAKNIHYIIIDDEVRSYCPDFLEKAKNGREVRHVYELKRGDRWLVVWELIDPSKGR